MYKKHKLSKILSKNKIFSYKIVLFRKIFLKHILIIVPVFTIGFITGLTTYHGIYSISRYKYLSSDQYLQDNIDAASIQETNTSILEYKDVAGTAIQSTFPNVVTTASPQPSGQAEQTSTNQSNAPESNQTDEASSQELALNSTSSPTPNPTSSTFEITDSSPLPSSIQAPTPTPTPTPIKTPVPVDEEKLDQLSDEIRKARDEKRREVEQKRKEKREKHDQDREERRQLHKEKQQERKSGKVKGVSIQTSFWHRLIIWIKSFF